MPKSFKLLILLSLLASFSKAQNLQLPNMPDSFEVRRFEIDTTDFIILNDLKTTNNFIINFNDIFNVSKYSSTFYIRTDKPENTSTFRNGMDTSGFALFESGSRYYKLINNSLYLTGSSDYLPVCTDVFRPTTHIEKPVLRMPLALKTMEVIFDSSEINFPI
jgi:hypothetical protein